MYNNRKRRVTVNFFQRIITAKIDVVELVSAAIIYEIGFAISQHQPSTFGVFIFAVVMWAFAAAHNSGS